MTPFSIFEVQWPAYYSRTQNTNFHAHLNILQVMGCGLDWQLLKNLNKSLCVKWQRKNPKFELLAKPAVLQGTSWQGAEQQTLPPHFLLSVLPSLLTCSDHRGNHDSIHIEDINAHTSSTTFSPFLSTLAHPNILDLTFLHL